MSNRTQQGQHRQEARTSPLSGSRLLRPRLSQIVPFGRDVVRIRQNDENVQYGAQIFLAVQLMGK